MLIVKTGFTRGVHEAERVVDAVISTPAQDRDGDIVEVSGWEMENFLKNPVVLWMHRYDAPVGRCLGIRREGDAIVRKPVSPEPLWLTRYGSYTGRAFSPRGACLSLPWIGNRFPREAGDTGDRNSLSIQLFLSQQTLRPLTPCIGMAWAGWKRRLRG